MHADYCSPGASQGLRYHVKIHTDHLRCQGLGQHITAEWTKRETLLAVNTDLSGTGQAANIDYLEKHSKKFNLHSQGQIQVCNLVMAKVQVLKMSFQTTQQNCAAPFLLEMDSTENSRPWKARKNPQLCLAEAGRVGYNNFPSFVSKIISCLETQKGV